MVEGAGHVLRTTEMPSASTVPTPTTSRCPEMADPSDWWKREFDCYGAWHDLRRFGAVILMLGWVEASQIFGKSAMIGPTEALGYPPIPFMWLLHVRVDRTEDRYFHSEILFSMLPAVRLPCRASHASRSAHLVFDGLHTSTLPIRCYVFTACTILVLSCIISISCRRHTITCLSTFPPSFPSTCVVCRCYCCCSLSISYGLPQPVRRLL